MRRGYRSIDTPALQAEAVGEDGDAALVDAGYLQDLLVDDR